jgi:ribosomal protein S18 acetylase RimI-like enzyme
LPFLFQVSKDAMKPVTDALHPDEVIDEARKFEEYKAKFEPGKVDIIQYESEDVGRLRIVRTPESIYVGGIQLKPEFQNLGIGTAIFSDLIDESKQSGIPIVLEVHNVNVGATAFYKKLGFVESEQSGDQTIMRFVPKP